MALLVTVLSAGCDTYDVASDETIVVEAYFSAGAPLPPVRVQRTVDVSSSGSAVGRVSGARVVVTVAGETLMYADDPLRAGLYLPPVSARQRRVQPGDSFSISVTDGDRTARAGGIVPPALNLEDVRIAVPDVPVAAILVDTLNIDLNARQGYIYPVEVSIDWSIPGPEISNSEFWIQTRLDPVNPFSSTLIDFFLLPTQIFREDAARLSSPLGQPPSRTWSGVYAVPVENESDPMPEHLLNIALLRSTPDYARFSTSRNDPARREPASNVNGGVGFVGGISVDSLTVTVSADMD